MGIVEDNPYNILTPGNTLKRALERPEFETYRNIKEKINGKCNGCKTELCYGCRVTVFGMNDIRNLPSLERVKLNDPMCPLYL